MLLVTREKTGGGLFNPHRGKLKDPASGAGSWGFSPHPRAWAAFLEWQTDKDKVGYEPNTLQFKGVDVITTKWWKDMRAAGKHPRMWTQWYMT